MYAISKICIEQKVENNGSGFSRYEQGARFQRTSVPHKISCSNKHTVARTSDEAAYAVSIMPSPSPSPLPSPSPSARDFEDLGFDMMRPNKSKGRRCNARTRHERFSSWFGTQPAIISTTWLMLKMSGWLNYALDPQPIHLLWAFLFLKTTT